MWLHNPYHHHFVQAAVKSSYGRRPPTGAGGGLKVPGTAAPGAGGLISSRGRMPTAGQYMSITNHPEFLSFNVKCSAIFDIWSTISFLLVIVIQSWAPSSFHELRSHAIVTLRRVSDNCKIPTLNSLQFPCSLLPHGACEIVRLHLLSPIIVSVTRDGTVQCALGVSQPIIDSQIFYWIHVS